jgi:phospholipid/cholesterol/gamma-HCH transport system ATP-binding protein
MSRSSDRPPLALEGFTRGPLRELSLRVAAGESVKVLVPSGGHLEALYAALTGASAPEAGQVFLFDAELYAQDEPGRLALLGRAGAVPRDGGLISNLKGWENLVLPAWYHRGRDAQALEAVAMMRFAALGFGEDTVAALMARLPDQLTPAQRRAIGLVRATLTEPPLMIYGDLLSGLERDSVSRWASFAAQYQREQEGRASLYLCPDDGVSAKIRADRTVRLDEI